MARHPGGEGGIRTPDRLAPMPHFECGAIDHSATSPGAMTRRNRPVLAWFQAKWNPGRVEKTRPSIKGANSDAKPGVHLCQMRSRSGRVLSEDDGTDKALHG